MKLSEERDDTGPEFIYGDCKLPEGEGGCSYPAAIRTSTTCSLNPISYGSVTSSVSLLRGGGLMTGNSEVGRGYVGTGDRTFTIESYEPGLRGAALREAHRRSQAAPEPLPPPVYPMAVLRELKRVTAAAERLHGIKAIASETELTPADVRFRLRIAEPLGPKALAGVSVPTMSTARVKRLIGLAVNFSIYPKRTAEKNGMTPAELGKLTSRVRGLAGSC
jgi:hypothetical protein